MAFRKPQKHRPRPRDVPRETTPAGVEIDPFGDLAAPTHSRKRHSGPPDNMPVAEEEDPFGDGMRMNVKKIPVARRTTPVVRFADQEPPSKKRKLANASPVRMHIPRVESPALSPEPPNAMEKAIEAAGEMHQTTLGPSRVEDPRPTVGIFLP